VPLPPASVTPVPFLLLPPHSACLLSIFCHLHGGHSPSATCSTITILPFCTCLPPASSWDACHLGGFCPACLPHGHRLLNSAYALPGLYLLPASACGMLEFSSDSACLPLGAGFCLPLTAHPPPACLQGYIPAYACLPLWEEGLYLPFWSRGRPVPGRSLLSSCSGISWDYHWASTTGLPGPVCHCVLHSGWITTTCRYLPATILPCRFPHLLLTG